MAILDVVHYGDPILRKECKPVTDYKILPEIIEKMFDILILITIIILFYNYII